MFPSRSAIAALLIFTGMVLRADCPTPAVPGDQGWHVRSVNFNFNTAYTYPGYYLTALSWTFLTAEQNDITAAFSTWTTANQSQNLSGVNFYSAGSNGPFRVYAYQVNYPGVQSEDPGRAAYTYVALYSGTTTIAAASTELYFGSISTGGGYPCYDSNDPNYHSFLTKVMLHEIGHTMHLGDQPEIVGAQCAGQVAGQSVMNYQCGTDDDGNNIPLTVTACDNASVM